MMGWLATQLGIGFMRVLAWMPLGWVRGLGFALGWLLYRAVASRRRIVLTNLRLCFPGLPEHERVAIARQTFICFAQTWLDRSWLWHAPREVLLRRLQLRGALYEFEDNRPLIMFCPHFYGLDAGGTAINMRINRDFISIYTPQSNPQLDEWIRTGRLRFGRARLFHRIDGVKAILKALRQGEGLYLLPDMDFGPDGSVFVPFFGVQAACVPSVSRFARLGRAKVISVVPRLTATGYDIEVLPAWKDFPTDDQVADTARVNRHLEEIIATMPAQYYWVHKRFKTRPPGEASVYDSDD
ncbi:MAG: lipid A biosynthesis acyltransferase [Pseudomonadota bacterium]